MSELHSFRLLFEKIDAEEQEIHQIKLPVPAESLTPVFSEEATHLHYGVLYKNYVTKALAGEGPFQVAGAKLHTLFFEQYQAPKSPNTPVDAIKLLIDNKFGSFQKFKDSFTESALTIHGSGWVYLDTNGKIKTIQNHKVLSDVAVIVDMWEHSYLIDYGSNKEKYLKEIWKIINWNIVNARLN
jgi:superoxide dismutase, Fe-Mn family